MTVLQKKNIPDGEKCSINIFSIKEIIVSVTFRTVKQEKNKENYFSTLTLFQLFSEYFL